MATTAAAGRLQHGGAFIIRAADGHLEDLARDATSSGVVITRRLPIINSLAVQVSTKGARRLASSPSLVAVARDAAVRPQGMWARSTTRTTTASPTTIAPALVAPTTAPATTTTIASTTTTIAPTATTTTTTVPATTTTIAPTTTIDEIAAVSNDLGSMRDINHQIKADELWADGFTGAGVDIAVIDTGVAPVKGLAGKIINGPDLSLDHPYTAAQGIDAFGHGTHMASLAAGVDPGTTNLSDPSKFVGVAPGARILNVKVGAFDGSTDVSQVIAAIDWVVQHRFDNGMNVKVLNLSYGTESTNNFNEDPLSWAAEAAIRNGITVVAAAGNDGNATKVLSPAYNPLVIGVGAVDQTQQPLSPTAFTNSGNLLKPDLWAPGSHVLGLRVPNSFIDARFPAARVGTRLLRGSGTSQATAIVSGAVALLASKYPNATPPQIRSALRLSGQDVTGTIRSFIDVRRADQLLAGGSLANVQLRLVLGTPGTGSLEASRGGIHLVADGVVLQGERDIFGASWNGPLSAASALAAASWQGGAFNGNGWTGNSWAGNSWAGASWAGNSWAGASWAGNSWAGASWAGASWAGNSWAGASWAGNSWAGNGWQGNVWG